MRGRRQRSWAGWVLALGVPGLLATGCGLGGDGDAGRADKYRQVLEDPSPRARDVAEIAGAPDGVARAGDGSLLLTYAPSNVEDDEGPAAFAWRLFAPDGKRVVAEHAEHTDAEAGGRSFVGTEDGFVFVPPGEGAEGAYFLDVRGKKHPERARGGPRAPARGDVLVSAWEPTLVHRPSTRTLAPVAGLPDDVRQLAVDDGGAAWGVEEPLGKRSSIVRLRDGETRRHPLPGRGASGAAVAARGDTAAVAAVQRAAKGGADDAGGDEEARVRALLVTDDGGKSWRTLEASRRLPLGELKQDPQSLYLDVLDDGRILVGEEAGSGDSGRAWLAEDRTNRTFRKVGTPAAFTSLSVHGNTLYGIADSENPSYGRVEGEGLWVSRDGGREWSRFDG